MGVLSPPVIIVILIIEKFSSLSDFLAQLTCFVYICWLKCYNKKLENLSRNQNRKKTRKHNCNATIFSPLYVERSKQLC
jgi:hypothetical protein